MPKNRRLDRFAIALWIGLLAPCGVVWGQAPATEIPAAPRFDITRFDVNGNTLLRPADIERAFAPYTGKNKDFSDIQRALEALEQAYRNRGYSAVQVLLPEQDITRGVVRLNVIEPRLGKVIVEGNQHFNEANIRSSLPGLQPGVTPNSRQIARNLQLLNEHPAKQTTVLLRSGASDNEIDATVKVTDERPLKGVVTLDNSGTPETGRWRMGFGVQHSNLFNRDHILNVQYVTNPDDPESVTIFGVGYRIPFYARNSSLDFFAGYADVDSGTLQGLFNVSGSGLILGTRYNLHLNKIGEYEHKIAFGLDYRAYRSDVTLVAGGGSLIPDITVHPVSVTYNGLWRRTNSEFGFYASYSRNLFHGGNDGADSDFKALRTDATAGYRILRGGAHYTHLLPYDWQFRAVINGQYTDDALIPGEQFAFGGPDSVRGFRVREVANDKGYSGSAELYTPEFGSKLGLKDIKVRALAFYDHGTTDRNSVQVTDPSPTAGENGASVGFGLRASWLKRVSLRLDFAQVINAAGTQSRNDHMTHASMALFF